MDATPLAGVSLAGFLVGWWLRGLSESKDPPLPCNCHCSCVHQGDNASTGWFGPGAYLLLALVGCIFVAIGSFAALAFKISFTQKGAEQELAISVKGKSKGVFNPRKALEITG